MELRVLRYFLAVADAGSITEGARIVRISQPAVSRQLRALEQEVGTPLFERGHGALRLTHAGRRFLGIARDLVRREEMARTTLGIDRIRETRFTVVAPFATILRTLAPFTAERGSSHPIIDAVEASPAVVFERAVEIGADLGVSTVPPPAGWSSRLLCEVGLSAHVPPDHPLAARRDVEVAELVQHPLVLMDRTNSARTVFDDALASERLEAVSAIEMASSFMAQGVAATGRGAAILTNEAVFGLRPVRIMRRGTQVRMRLYAGWDPSHYAAGTIERWVEDFADWLPTIPDIAGVEAPPS